MELGSRGPEVEVLQQKLASLGFKVESEEQGIFGVKTRQLLIQFQESRNLKTNGKCTNDTWKHLTEATWKLGDRLLYIRKPMFRGDDVAELQTLLSSLGFSSGKIDGIFGPQTLEAIKDFQQNQNINTDGIVGPNTLKALNRVKRHNITEVVCIDNLKEFINFTSKIKSAAKFKLGIGDLGGSNVLVHLFNKQISSLNLNSEILTGLSERSLIAQANNTKRDLCIFFQYDASIYSFNVYHYKGFRYESKPGMELGKLVSDNLYSLGLSKETGGISGCSFPILRETRMLTILVELGREFIYPINSYLIANAICDAITNYFS